MAPTSHPMVSLIPLPNSLDTGRLERPSNVSEIYKGLLAVVGHNLFLEKQPAVDTLPVLVSRTSLMNGEWYSASLYLSQQLVIPEIPQHLYGPLGVGWYR
ncbi:hypothetical protein Tco_0149041 [Tanacetum coccineum]